MKTADETEIVQAITLLTAEYDMPPFEEVRIEMWLADLVRFPSGSVLKSAQNFIRTSKFKPQLSEIVKGCEAQIPVLWLTGDEVWARMPKSERESAMMCNETAEALAIAMPLLEAGEESAARLAFRGAYTRLSEKAKIEGRAPAYFFAQGTNKAQSTEVLAAAVTAGQIGMDQALAIMPAESDRLTRAAGKPQVVLIGGGRQAGKTAALKAILLTMKPKMFGKDGVIEP